MRKATAKSPEKVYLSTVFLAKRYKVNPEAETLAYSVTLAIRVPDYEVAKQFWPDRHYEGEYLFRDSVVIELKPPEQEERRLAGVLRLAERQRRPGHDPISPKELKNGKVVVPIPFATADATPPRSPGSRGSCASSSRCGTWRRDDPRQVSRAGSRARWQPLMRQLPSGCLAIG